MNEQELIKLLNMKLIPKEIEEIEIDQHRSLYWSRGMNGSHLKLSIIIGNFDAWFTIESRNPHHIIELIKLHTKLVREELEEALNICNKLHNNW